MAGRTLLQQALPITFGLKAAGWLDAALDARAGLRRVRLDAQLGGAAGTLAALGEDGPRVAASFAARLGLGAPELPWHSARGRVAELGAALAVAAGAMGKTALDLVLLAQTEVGEVVAGTGGSSTLPHKQNPVGAVRARACAARVAPHAGRDAAKAAVQAAAAASAARFRDALLAQPVVVAHLDGAALDALLDPAGYLGATHVFIERALARAERELPA